MECERLSRFCIAYDYNRAEKFVRESSSELVCLTEETARLKALTRNKQNKIIDLEQNISILEKKKDQVSSIYMCYFLDLFYFYLFIYSFLRLFLRLFLFLFISPPFRKQVDLFKTWKKTSLISLKNS